MLDNAALLKAALKMDRGALITIFDQYAPDIYKYLYRLCNDPVVSDEIVGDVFSELLEQCATGSESIINLRIFLYQVAYRRLAEHFITDQDMKRSKTNAKIIIPITQSPALSDEENNQIGALLVAINFHLNDIQRHVMILRFLEGFSLKETAVIVGKNVSSVKVTQNRALVRLQKILWPGLENQGPAMLMSSNAPDG
jgi:RNA polymerase sigma-70 factor (ECF subfamily)